MVFSTSIGTYDCGGAQMSVETLTGRLPHERFQWRRGTLGIGVV